MAGHCLKVLYIDASMGFGGATKSLSLLLRGFRSVEPIVVTHQYEDIARKWYRGLKLYRFRRVLDVRTHNRMQRWFATRAATRLGRKVPLKALGLFSRLQHLVSTAYVVRVAMSNRVDLIHMNNGVMTPGGFAASALLGIPYIAHARGFLIAKTKAVVPRLRRAAHIIGVSDAVSESVRAHGICPTRVTTIADPVDVDLFAEVANSDARARLRARHRLLDSDVAVGIFGRVVQWKGQLEFVRAAQMAMRANRAIRAFIVGDESDGPPGYMDEIKAVISASPYAQYFKLTGYQQYVESFYALMDIVVHASIEPEPFGMVVTEGMAASRPVIATNAGGPAEVIQSGVDGILVPPRDVDQMAAAILELADDPHRREMLATHAHAKIRTYYTIERIASRVEELYHDVARHNGSSSAAGLPLTKDSPRRGRRA